MKDYAWTADDYRVSELMVSYFANFIKTGNPNGEKLPEWPVAKGGNSTPPVMLIDTETKSENAPHDARFQFLEKANKVW